jgi:hypothetical protein
MADEKKRGVGGLEVCKISSLVTVVDTLSVTVFVVALFGGLVRRGNSSTWRRPFLNIRPVRALGSAAEARVGLAESGRDTRRAAPPMLFFVNTTPSFQRPFSLRTLRGHGISGRGRRGVSTPSIGLVVHVGRHSVWLLGAVGDPGHARTAGDRHGAIPAASAIAELTTPSSTALGTSVRGLVDTDLSSVEPEAIS